MCVLTGAFVWEPDLALELLSNLGQLGVGSSDVLQTLEEGEERRGGGKRSGLPAMMMGLPEDAHFTTPSWPLPILSLPTTAPRTAPGSETFQSASSQVTSPQPLTLVRSLATWCILATGTHGEHGG